MNQPSGDSCEQSYLLYTQPVERAEKSPAAGKAVKEYPGADSRGEVDTDPCEVCGSKRARVLYTLPGTRFLTVQCTHCQLGSLWPKPELQELIGFYPEHYYGNDGRKFSLIVEWLVRVVGARHSRFFAGLMPKEGRVLDVGCGRGITLHALMRMGFQTYGFEVSSAAVEGVDSGIQIRVGESLQDAAFPDDFFDEVMLWHVLEHIPAPAATMAEVCRILKPGGVVIVAVPNFSSWQARWCGPSWFHLDPPRHLYHFPLRGLKRLLENAGFQCQSEHHFSLRQNPFGWIQSILNLCPWLPRNGLYAVLHRLGNRRPPFTLAIRLQLWALCGLLAPISLVLSVIAAICRQGATVHVVARRPRTESPSDARRTVIRS